jgi:hypothetical protein
MVQKLKKREVTTRGKTPGNYRHSVRVRSALTWDIQILAVEVLLFQTFCKEKNN